MENSDFSLVRRQSLSLGKAPPAAKRLMGRVVVDALALVTNPKPDLAEPLGGCPKCGHNVFEAADSYDCGYKYCDFRIEKVIYSRLIGRDDVKTLLAAGASELLDGFINERGVSYSGRLLLQGPFDVVIARPLRVKRRLRIVAIDDIPEVLQAYETLIRSCLDGAEFIKFDNGDDAWRELSARDPDFLITDLCRPGLRGEETLKRLEEKNVIYPILVISSSISQNFKRWSGVSKLKIEIWEKPFDGAIFCRHLMTRLISPRPGVRSSQQ
jgi:CheY-like chemotaxis protein